ncbi:type II secretion system protein GspE [Desulfolithobacter dissulfuricans]|uniref:protein-secreting ATPase n=1 Tax=Desulfolithobacter dissulfuricans TaxID=2795293 RepID=A0A915U1Q8_9BACT|nr:type II secretion system protein GspE [Desulfolithobacter dissulfuricans]
MKSLGEILTQEFHVPPEAIDQALQQQQEKGGRIGEILVQHKKISEHDLLLARSHQSGLEIKHSLPQDLDHFFVDRIPIQFLKKYKMIPVATREESFIAIGEPLYFQQLDDLQRILDWEGVPTFLAPQEEIFVAINRAYDLGRDSADQVMQDMDAEDPEAILSEIEETADLLDDTSDAPVIKLVNLMLSQAVRDNASDIHIEPFKDRVKIRKRVDGILYDMFSPPKHVQAKLISRIKIMARMDIAERRLPQDGRIEIRIADRNIDLRVSTLPTAFGERVVMRLLDKSNVLLSLEQLGMSRRDLDTFMELIKAPHGILLVTGPTGSGKTTTLYSALSILNRPDVNIITVEDPIEYQINGISQMQVNPKIDLTFANGLRTIVRQDPDIILVGEIRDLETAEIAIQAALTGHLVFSTLHTNDAASAVTRLIDMGLEPFLVSSSVNAILAQRLVRKICPNCKEAYRPSPEYLDRAGLTSDNFKDQVLYRGRGCPECFNTGYQGRVGIFELMVLDDTLKSLILTTSDAGQIRNQAIASRATGMHTLRQDGLRKVLEGITTLEEVFRVT